MTTKILQIFWLLLATLFVGVIVWFVSDSLTVTTIAAAYTAVLGLFLGTDIVTMIHKTRNLQPGDYKEVNTHRYVLALFIFILLLTEAVIISMFYGREVHSLYLCFGIGFLVVIGGLISGVEMNKIATDECVCKTEEKK